MNLVEAFEKEGVILKGHFKLTSGRHSNLYINKDRIFTKNYLFRECVDQIVDIISKEYKTNQYDIITGPAIAGSTLAAPIAMFVKKDFVYPEKNIRLIYSSKTSGLFEDNKSMKFRRGYDKKIKNKKVIITEDIITTGGSVQQTIKAIEKCNGTVVGVISIWNRTNWKPMTSSIHSLINDEIHSWLPDECPDCKNGIVLQDPKNL